MARLLALILAAPRLAAAVYGDSQLGDLEHDVALLQTTVALEQLSRHAEDVALLSHRDEPTTTVEEKADAAAVSGVETNAAGDLTTFFTGLATDFAMILASVIAFLVFRHRYPLIFVYGSISGRVPDTPKEDFTSWISAAFAKKLPDHVKYCGLDHAMLIEFTSMSMRLLGFIGAPMVLIMGPLNFFFGHGDAEKVGDNLSRIAMGNVRNGHPWLYYIYSLITILVVWVVRNETFRSMRMFCHERAEWLKRLENPQASTVMVEGIPEDFQQDEKVESYFNRMFGSESVSHVHVCKTIPALEQAYAELKAAKDGLELAKAQWEAVGKEASQRPTVKPSVMSEAVDAIDHWTAQIAQKTAEVEAARANCDKDAKERVGGVNGHSAFVTFRDRRDARVAVNMKMAADTTTWQVSLPPPPGDIVWSDLKVNVELRGVRRVIGYGLVFGLYVAFTPFCLFVTNLATAIDLGPFQSLWSAYAPTLGLMIFLAFAPTVLINIFQNLFNFKSEVWNQRELQNWYFWFLVFFVIGVTVVGQDFLKFVKDVAADPVSLPLLLADKMPSSTHYYLNFLGLQWVTHAMNLTRYIQVSKFVAFSKIWNEDDARALSEPEDQDYYGMGSRSARFTTNLLIALIFGTISPLMSLLAWINFWLCRVIYGYLFVYAESKKQDSGGHFFVNQLNHVFIGLIVYTVLMTGMFLRRAPTYVPAGGAIFALIWAVQSHHVFRNAFEWESLPWEEIAQDADGKEKIPEDSGHLYVQPELAADLTAK
mmetsp:Transcript_7868/g.14264  ORF Transcript_7868/g.14264 Transcript_7868/m.14264 type:complete len:764 (-) Transcript_7868:172-2463(-)